MKRKVRKFSEGDRVYDKEDEGLLGAKIKYREDEDGRKYTAGKANPFDRNPQEQRYYSMDDIKGNLSGLFGGKSKAAESEEDYTDAKRRARTIEEQIKGRPGREIEGKEFAPYRRTPEPEKGSTLKPEPAPSKGGTTYTNEEAINRVDTKPNKEAAPKKEKREVDAPKKNVGESAKPLPGVSKDKDKPKNLPGKKEKEKEPTPYKDVVKSEDVGSQSFASPKKEPPLRKVGEAIKGTLENANKPFRSSMYDKMKGRKDGGSIKMAKGGSASSRGDGIAARGKTRGKIC